MTSRHSIKSLRVDLSGRVFGPFAFEDEGSTSVVSVCPSCHIGESSEQLLRQAENFGGSRQCVKCGHVYDLPTVHPMVAWQPIETAPLDIDVLMFCPEVGPTNHERIEMGHYGSTNGGWRHSWATHWMPLPKGPKV